MDSYEGYRKILRETADYAFHYGASTFGIDRIKTHPATTWNQEWKAEFMACCHDGFKKAQKIIIEQLVSYQTELRQSKLDLKLYRRQRDKQKSNQTSEEIAIIEQRIYNFSHIADGIAWQLLNGQLYIARRLHLQIDASKFLDSSNIGPTIAIADQINQNPLHFALLSDLTSFIHIGDLLIRKEETVTIAEVKDGVINHSIREFYDQQHKTINEVDEKDFKEKFNATTVEQVKRMQRQVTRGLQALEVINTDKGTDPATGKEIIINTPTISTEFYNKELRQLYLDLKDKTWAYTVVEECIHIGMYRDEGLLLTRAIPEIMKATAENYFIIDWLSITRNLSAPIFIKPFPPEFIIDIMTGKIKVIMGLDLDALIELFNLSGIPARWMSKKETTKAKEGFADKTLIIVNHRGISYKLGEHEIFMGGGIASKLLYDCIRPSNIASTLLSAYEDK